MPAFSTASALDLARRTLAETRDDDGFGLAAQLAYYFFLSLFPAMLFVLAIASFFSLGSLTVDVVQRLGMVLPESAMTIVREQVARIADRHHSGLLTFGFAGALWSTSTALVSIIGAMNRAYDVEETRSWWRVRLTAIGLTLVIAVTTLGAAALVVGNSLAERLGLGQFVAASGAVPWLAGLVIVCGGLTVVYRFAADVDQGWSWSWPGAVLATLLWLAASLGFRYYASNFGSYAETYGAVGGVIVMLLWLYLLGLAIVAGAELNSEIEFASTRADSKNPGARAAGQAGTGDVREKGPFTMHTSDDVDRLREEAAAARAAIDRLAVEAADSIRARAHPARLVAMNPALTAGAAAGVAAAGAWWWRRGPSGPAQGAAALPPSGTAREHQLIRRMARAARYAGMAVALLSAITRPDGTRSEAKGGAA